MRKKRIWIAVGILLQIMIMVLCFLKPNPDTDITFGQDDLFIGGEAGFYLNQDPSTERVCISTQEMALERGTYVITVRYENRGGGFLRVLYADGLYGNDIAGNLMLKESRTEMSFPVKIGDGSRSILIQAYQRLSRESSDYLLIRELGISTDPSAKWKSVISLFCLLAVLDAVILIWHNKSVRSCLRKNAVLIMLFSIVMFFTSLPVFVDYLPSGMLDINFHMTRIAGLKQGLLSGQFPVRIQPGWLNDHGYAVSVFYGDLLLYFPALLAILGMPLQTAYQCFVLAVNIATIWTAWYACQKMTGDRTAGMFGAVLYTTNLYRVIALYTRAAVGAYCSMIFFPLVMLGLWYIYTETGKGVRKGILPLTIGFSGILESHFISTEMSVAFTALLCLILWKKTFQKARFWALCQSVGITILANLWFLLPFLDYIRDDFHVNYNAMEMNFHYKMQDRGLFLAQPFLSDFAVAGRSLDITVGVKGEMPLSIGFSMTLILVAGLLLWAYKISRGEKWKEFSVCISMVIMSILLTQHYFTYIKLGELFPFAQAAFRSIQYNWRFLTMTAILLLWMFCIVSKEIQKDRKRYVPIMACICIISVLQAVDFSSSVLNEMNPDRIYSEYNLDMNAVGGGEYLPMAANENDLKDEVVSGLGVTVESWTRTKKGIQCRVQNLSDQVSAVELPLLSYRYYRAYDGENLLPVSSSEKGKVLVGLEPMYQGEITVEFREPAVWRGAELVSFITVVLVILAVWRERSSKGREYTA